MRLMMTIKIPVEHGNKAFADGSMQKAFEALMERLKPEAAYFMMLDGQRAAVLFYEARDEFRIFEAHEPMLAAMGALIDETPALSWEDMARGFTDMR
jgi:hypothetical protein